jgi:hypothetical protein
MGETRNKWKILEGTPLGENPVTIPVFENTLDSKVIRVYMTGNFSPVVVECVSW